MRILMIHNRWGPQARGGAERVIERLVTVLVARGHIVEVHHRTTVGFRVLERMPAVLRACWHTWDLVSPFAARAFARRIRTFRPDVIHSHNLVGCGGLTSWVIRRSGIPHVHTVHDVQLLTPSGIWMGDRPATALERSFLGAWYRACRRWSMGSPAVVVSPSQWCMDQHHRYGFFAKSELVIIGNPVALPERMPAPRGAVRRFCFIGQIEGQKGVHVLIEVFRQLHALAPDVTLQLVGVGSMFEHVKRVVRGARGIMLRGQLDADGVAAALAESDVLVAPSLVAENQPSVILEAYAWGVPVIATRVGGIPEIVEDGTTGFLIDAGSSEELLRCLRVCVEDPTRIRAMSVACRARAETHAVERVADALLNVYAGGAYAASREPVG